MERRSERRLVSCVFIDLVGSTDMGQRLGPERMQRVLSDSFREISAIATEAGGTIEKYIGDEVFILFGAPAAHSDDVIRALRVAESSVRWAATSPNPISIRVGNGNVRLNPLNISMKRGIMKNMKKAIITTPTQHTSAG